MIFKSIIFMVNGSSRTLTYYHILQTFLFLNTKISTTDSMQFFGEIPRTQKPITVLFAGKDISTAKEMDTEANIALVEILKL